VRREGDPATGDPAADEAYDGLGATYALFWDVFERDSIDGRGLPLQAVVHYGEEYDNAFWDGERMVFGDGDGETFNRFTIAIDIIAHELAHGVTDSTARLEYQGQSGALNESVSDCFGAMVKQRALGQDAADADWLIGAGLLAAGVDGVALRSMAAPGTAYDDERLGGRDPQPAHMDDFVETTADNGGVHINSGIPNKAFQLAATGIGGTSWGGAGPRLVRRADRGRARRAGDLRRVRPADRGGRGAGPRRARGGRRPRRLGGGRCLSRSPSSGPGPAAWPASCGG
jgi:Zn-dependent metalloprotease